MDEQKGKDKIPEDINKATKELTAVLKNKKVQRLLIVHHSGSILDNPIFPSQHSISTLQGALGSGIPETRVSDCGYMWSWSHSVLWLLQ